MRLSTEAGRFRFRESTVWNFGIVELARESFAHRGVRLILRVPDKKRRRITPAPVSSYRAERL